MERPPSLPTSASSSHFHPPSVSSAVEPEPYPSQSAGKRKADGDADAPDKRRRLGLPDSAAHLPPVAGLPAHLWQNVFLYLPPVSLGRLLQVNRAFYTLLTRVDEPDHGSHLPPSQRLVSSESIWSSARKTYFPTIPRPLMAHSELSMWRLLKGRRCQFCTKTPRFDPHPASVWEGGPAAEGVRVIWHFGIRSCGRCLEERSQSVCRFILSPPCSTSNLAARNNLCSSPSPLQPFSPHCLAFSSRTICTLSRPAFSLRLLFRPISHYPSGFTENMSRTSTASLKKSALWGLLPEKNGSRVLKTWGDAEWRTPNAGKGGNARVVSKTCILPGGNQSPPLQLPRAVNKWFQYMPLRDNSP